MRNVYILLFLAAVLVAIAFVARSGFFSREHPGEPANKYMRETMDTPQTPQLSTEETAVIGCAAGGKAAVAVEPRVWKAPKLLEFKP